MSAVDLEGIMTSISSTQMFDMNPGSGVLDTWHLQQCCLIATRAWQWCIISTKLHCEALQVRMQSISCAQSKISADEVSPHHAAQCSATTVLQQQ